MRQKKGQFYLIAAVIIIAMIAGFAVIVNYSERKEAVKLYNLGEELGIESENVLDYGTYNELNEEEMEDLLINFTESYAEYGEEGKDLYFIFGNRDKVTVVAYQELAGEISVDVGEGNLPLVISGGTGTQEFYPSTNKVVVTINGIEYEFKLKKGENFYFVISQEIEGEKYVITN